MNLTTRRMLIDGDVHYEVTGKLRQSTWDDVLASMDGPNATVKSTRINMRFETTSSTSRAWSTDTLVDTRTNIHGVVTYLNDLDPGYGSLEVYSGRVQGLHSWDGYFRIRIRASGDGAVDAQKAAQLLKSVGLDDLTKTPTKTAEETLKTVKLVWPEAPKRSSELTGLSGRSLLRKAQEIAKQEGIDLSRTANMILQKRSMTATSPMWRRARQRSWNSLAQSMFIAAYAGRLML